MRTRKIFQKEEFHHIESLWRSRLVGRMGLQRETRWFRGEILILLCNNLTSLLLNFKVMPNFLSLNNHQWFVVVPLMYSFDLQCIYNVSVCKNKTRDEKLLRGLISVHRSFSSSWMALEMMPQEMYF